MRLLLLLLSMHLHDLVAQLVQQLHPADGCVGIVVIVYVADFVHIAFLHIPKIFRTLLSLSFFRCFPSVTNAVDEGTSIPLFFRIFAQPLFLFRLLFKRICQKVQPLAPLVVRVGNFERRRKFGAVAIVDIARRDSQIGSRRRQKRIFVLYKPKTPTDASVSLRFLAGGYLQG